MDRIILRADGAPVKPNPAVTDRLPPNARTLMRVLERKARGHAECWSSNLTLASCLRCCQRTVRNALRRLASLGLVRVVRDYSLSTRRRILLLWRSAPADRQPPPPAAPAPPDDHPAPPAPGDASVGETISATVSVSLSATGEPPPDPPRGEELSRDEDDELTGPASSSSDSPQGGIEESGPDPDELARVVAEAREHVDPWIGPRQVLKAVRDHGTHLPLVGAAIEATRGKGPKSDRWFYVLGAVRNMVADRGPLWAPAPPPPPPRTDAEVRADADRRAAEFHEEQDRRLRADAARKLAAVEATGRSLVWDAASWKFIDLPDREGLPAPAADLIRSLQYSHDELRALLRARPPLDPAEFGRRKAIRDAEDAERERQFKAHMQTVRATYGPRSA